MHQSHFRGSRTRRYFLRFISCVLVGALVNLAFTQVAEASKRSSYNPYPDYSWFFKEPSIKGAAIGLGVTAAVVVTLLVITKGLHSKKRTDSSGIPAVPIHFGCRGTPESNCGDWSIAIADEWKSKLRENQSQVFGVSFSLTQCPSSKFSPLARREAQVVNRLRLMLGEYDQEVFIIAPISSKNIRSNTPVTSLTFDSKKGKPDPPPFLLASQVR